MSSGSDGHAPKAAGRGDGREKSQLDGADTENVGSATPSGRALAPSDTPMSKRSGVSWADMNGSDDDPGDPEDPLPRASRETDEVIDAAVREVEHWTERRIEHAAKRGFELRRRGDHWDLRIVMASLEPRLTEAGMERYCNWLRERLSAFREEHGPECLRRCRGEVDFSHNYLTNQMVWMLLETLAENEVHAALLKLFGNHISHAGVLALCEFIRMNERAEAIHELHLSHNDIDDESALELLRTLHSQRPRYPPRRSDGGSGEAHLAPVWLRLNQNRVREPAAVLRTAEAEGITVCTAWDRQHCGTSKCCRRGECPLVHLYSFSVQAAQQKPNVVAGGGGRGESNGRRHRKGPRGEDAESRYD